MEPTQQKKSDETAAILISMGYIFFFFLAFMVLFAYYFFHYFSGRTSAVNLLATNLPPRTPTPHISLTAIPNADVIFEDDFSTDENQWKYRANSNSEIKITDGRLMIQSPYKGTYAVTKCNACPYVQEPYFLQVNLETSAATNIGYGIAFNIGRIEHLLYLFDINPESKEYRLYHETRDGWAFRMSGKSDFIRPYPEANRLGIYANKDTVDFYINDNLIDSYTEEGVLFYQGYFGVLVDDGGPQVFVDDLIVSKVGN